MKFIQADAVFPIVSNPIINGIIGFDSDGTIQEIIDPATTSVLPSNVEQKKGFICPGFINTHCHLELSHLKGKFEQKKGLINFINQMRTNRTGDDILEAIALANDEMFQNGIVAVADISNNESTLNEKLHSKIYYHTFIELFDVVPERTSKVLDAGKALYDQFAKGMLSASLVPHAPYTVTADLFEALSSIYFEKNFLSSIHNQETPDEDRMFQSESGSVFDFLFSVNNEIEKRNNQSASSIDYTLSHLKNFEKLLLVHNTFTSEEQIKAAQLSVKNLYWCFCPNANLYIEDRLPSISIFTKSDCKITLGTDSYASNHSLSILDELKTIAFHFPELSLHELLKWATFNGAEFLGIERKFGSFENGKKPGIVLIENVDSMNMKLKTDSKSHRIDV